MAEGKKGTPAPEASSNSMVTVLRRALTLAIFYFVTNAYLQQANESKFHYHPIAMSAMLLCALPELMSSVANVKRNRGCARGVRLAAVTRHQVSAFLLQICAGVGFGAIYYTKFSMNLPLFQSPHAMVGTCCGVALLCEVTVGVLLRYVFVNATSGMHSVLLTIHGLLSATICITGILAMAGGLLATSFAERAIPNATYRGILAVAPLLTISFGYLS